MAHDQADAPEADEVHISPDGALRLVVFYGDDPMLGFDGLAWHVHGDMFPEQGAPREVISAWAADILSDKRAIIECWKDGVRLDAWTPESNDFDVEAFLAEDQTHRQHGEDWRVRRWSSAR